LHQLIGEIYLKLEKFDKAREPLEKAVSLNPTNSDAHFLLAMYFMVTGGNEHNVDKLKKAIEELELCLKNNPSDDTKNRATSALITIRKVLSMN
jgi:Tfp pilus assembly protein PilF